MAGRLADRAPAGSAKLGSAAGTTLSRRKILSGAAVMAVSGWAGRAVAQQGGGRTRVVFLSRSSNTRMLAGQLARSFGADLHEIRPRDPWPEDYEEMVDWASRWRQSDSLLPLESRPDPTGAELVFVGFPIWGAALPAPMRSFLANTDLSGKTLVPFVTHGGFGLGNALDELRGLAPAAEVIQPFVLRCDQERDNLNALTAWLRETPAVVPQ